MVRKPVKLERIDLVQFVESLLKDNISLGVIVVKCNEELSRRGTTGETVDYNDIYKYTTRVRNKILAISDAESFIDKGSKLLQHDILGKKLDKSLVNVTTGLKDKFDQLIIKTPGDEGVKNIVMVAKVLLEGLKLVATLEGRIQQKYSITRELNLLASVKQEKSLAANQIRTIFEAIKTSNISDDSKAELLTKMAGIIDTRPSEVSKLIIDVPKTEYSSK